MNGLFGLLFGPSRIQIEHSVQASHALKAGVQFIILHHFSVLPSKNGHKGSSGASVKRPVVDEERICPGHWLASILCLSLSALIGDRKDIP